MIIINATHPKENTTRTIFLVLPASPCVINPNMFFYSTPWLLQPWLADAIYCEQRAGVCFWQKYDYYYDYYFKNTIFFLF